MQLPHDRRIAGRRLAPQLATFCGQDIVVVGLARGGVPVAFEVAKALKAPIDVLVVRKLNVPFRDELPFGVVAEEGIRVINDAMVEQLGLTDAEIAVVEELELDSLRHQVELYHSGHQRIPLSGRVALIVDDGLITGTTARAACQAVRAGGAERVVVAATIGTPDAVELLRSCADEVVCGETPEFLFYTAMDQGYNRFRSISDDEIIALLEEARAGQPVKQ